MTGTSSTPLDTLPDGLRPTDPNPLPRIAARLDAIGASLNAAINLVNRIDSISKDAMQVSDDLLDWLLAHNDSLALVPEAMDSLLAFSGRLLALHKREVDAYNDILDVLGAQVPKMTAGL